MVMCRGVAASTAFPTDISIPYKILDRARRILLSLKDFGLAAKLPAWAATRLEKMSRHLKLINMNVGKKGVKGKVLEAFRSFLLLGGKALSDIEAARDALTPQWEAADLGVRRDCQLDALWDKLEQDLADARYALHCAALRLGGAKLPATERILSVAGRDAAYIQKGQRVPVIGYRPQLARSGNGFVCGQLVPWGNAADAAMLQPLVERVVGATGVTPETVGTDDGYASDENLSFPKDVVGVKDVSFGGAKGRKVMGDSDWSMPYIAAARAGRSAVESLMFTMKHNHGYGQLRRRGLDAVEAELTEEVIAYNFMHMRRREETALAAAS